jgi:hypothetical protein
MVPSWLGLQAPLPPLPLLLLVGEPELLLLAPPAPLPLVLPPPPPAAALLLPLGPLPSSAGRHTPSALQRPEAHSPPLRHATGSLLQPPLSAAHAAAKATASVLPRTMSRR